MYQPLKSSLIRLSLLISLLSCPATLIASGQAASSMNPAAIPKVVVSIKPLYSLVAGIMRGAGKPELLISGNASPHHYSLKPSQRRLLSEAELVFWIGPELESFMPRVLDSMKQQSSQVIELGNSDGLLRLPIRHHSHAHHDTTHDKTGHSENTDPHIWLHTSNLSVMANSIYLQLSQHDPARAELYKQNNQQLQTRIKQLKQDLQQTLSTSKQSFISYHDAYQYFETEFQLNNRGVVSINENVKPGARHLRELRNKIQQNNIRCLFYDAPTRPPLLNTLTSGLEIKTQAVDASGILLAATEDSLFELFRTLGDSFKQCLSETN